MAGLHCQASRAGTEATHKPDAFSWGVRAEQQVSCAGNAGQAGQGAQAAPAYRGELDRQDAGRAPPVDDLDAAAQAGI